MSYDIGPRIGIDGEKEFRAAITQINTNLKTLDTEMAAVTSQYDKNDKSQEALTAKNQVLTKQIEEQTLKLQKLQEGLNASNEKYGESDKVTQGWQQALNKATADLNNMERELKNNVSAMDNSGDAVKELGKDLDNAGEKALSFGDVLKANLLSNIIIDGVKALGNAFKSMAEAALESADSIQKMADQTGMSAEQIQEWQYVGDAVGTSIETITGAQRKLTKSMSEAADGSKSYKEAFKALGISVVDGNGNLRDAKVVMEEALTALGKIENETQRDAVAMDIFGKSAADLNPLIKAGADEINRLGQQARDTGAIMSNETVANLDNFGDTVDQIKQSVKATAGTILSELIPSLQPVIDAIKNIDTKKIVDGLKWIIDNSGTLVAGLTAMGVAFGVFQVAGIIDGVVKSIKAFRLANEGATLAQWALNAAMSANPIGIVIALIAGLAAGIVVLWNKNEDFRKAVIGAWNELKQTGIDVFERIKKFFIEDIPKAFNTVIDFLKNNWKEILLFITNPIAGAIAFLYKLNPQFKEWVDGVWKNIVDTFKSIGDVNWIELGSNIIKGIAQGVANAAKGLASSVANAAKEALNAAKDFLGIHSPSRVMRDEVGMMIGAGMALGISDSAKKVSAAMQGLNNQIVDGQLNYGVNSNVDSRGAAGGTTSSGDIILQTTLNVDGKPFTTTVNKYQFKDNQAVTRLEGVA